MANFQDLTQEIFDLVVQDLDDEDLMSCRLLSRQCNIKVLPTFTTVCFSSQAYIVSDVRSLKIFESVAQHDIFGKALQNLAFCVDNHETYGRPIPKVLNDGRSRAFRMHRAPGLVTKSFSECPVELLSSGLTYLRTMGRCGKVAILITDIETVGNERGMTDDEISNELYMHCELRYDEVVPIVVEAIASSAFEASQLAMQSSGNNIYSWPNLYALVPQSDFEQFMDAFSKLRALELTVYVSNADTLHGFFSLTGLFSSLSQLEQLRLTVKSLYGEHLDWNQVMQTGHILHHYYPVIKEVFLEDWLIDIRDFERFIQRHKATLVAVEVLESTFDCTSALNSAWVKPLRRVGYGEATAQILKQKTGFDGIELIQCNCVHNFRHY